MTAKGRISPFRGEGGKVQSWRDSPIASPATEDRLT